MAVAELYAIAGAMRRAGSGGIANDVRTELRRGRAPIHNAMLASVLAKLPHRGGLAVWVAESSFSYRVGGDRARVRVSKAGHDLGGLDNGVVVHPFYGRGPWSTQPVPPGTISDPIREEGGNQLELAAVVAIELAAEKIIHA